MITVTDAELNAWLAGFLWPLFRVLGLFSTAPLLSHRSVPIRVRIGLALLVTLLLAPSISQVPAVPLSSWNGLMIAAREVMIGLAIGFLLQLMFAAIQLAGDVVGLQMGLSFGGFIDPTNNQQTPLLGTFLGLFALLIFLSINGPLIMLAGMMESFRTMPIAMSLEGLPHVASLAQMGGIVFTTGLQLALPILATMLITNIALGILSRTAPQLNVFAVGFPITLSIGALTLLIMLPYWGPAMERLLTEHLQRVLW